MKKKESKVSLIARFMHGALPWFIVTILASAAVTLCETLMPQIVSITVDSVIGAKPFTLPDWVIGLIGMENLERLRGRLLLMAIAVIVVAAGNFLFRYLQRVSSAKGSERYVKNMRDALFSHIQKLPFSWHSANRTGDIIQRCTSDVEQVRNFVTGQLIEVFSVVFHIVISLLFMYSMNVKIALAATAFMPVVFFYSMYFHQRIAHRFTEADETEGGGSGEGGAGAGAAGEGLTVAALPDANVHTAVAHAAKFDVGLGRKCRVNLQHRAEAVEGIVLGI